MKKIIIVNASPRKGGNSDAITARLSADIKNADIEVFTLREKKVNPCMACDACKGKPAAICVQKDDMGALISRIDACDAIVLLSPIYFGHLNGPAKTFIDRLYCFFDPSKPNASLAARRGRKCAIICCCGAGPADIYAKTAESNSGGFAVAGADETKVYVCGGVNEPGSVVNHTKDIQAVDDIAAWLAN